MLTIRALFDEKRERLSLVWLAGQSGSGKPLPAVCCAGPDVVGYLNLIHPDRIQIVGRAEAAYTARLDPARGQHLLTELIAAGVPAFIVSDGLEPPLELRKLCEQHGVPLMGSPVPGAQVIDILRIYLAKKLAPSTTVHGVLLDVLGMGVLITGESGLGKSELALELISRGHGLVADDAVELLRIAPEIIEGRCPALLQNLLEVRGLGLLDIRAIFGETSVRRKMKVKLIVHLIRGTADDGRYERLPLQEQAEDILGCPIRKVVLPVAAGRNLAVLVEAAVRNAILQLRGIDTLRDFMARQQQAMRDSAEPEGP
jgi:HPr kinase/phosphorylase